MKHSLLGVFFSWNIIIVLSIFINMIQGKIKPLKLLQSNTDFVPVFSRLGNAEEILEHDLTHLEEFVCRM